MWLYAQNLLNITADLLFSYSFDLMKGGLLLTPLTIMLLNIILNENGANFNYFKWECEQIFAYL